MKQDMKKLECGACGESKVEIYQQVGSTNELIAECCNCKSETIISIRPAEIKLDWGIGDGILCI